MLNSIEKYRNLFAFLRISVIPKNVSSFIENLVHGAINEREKLKEKKTDDLTDLLNAVWKGTDNPINYNEVFAHAGAIFVAGHDNLTSSIRHTLYELSKNPALQTRCRESIKEVLKKHNNELTYEAIMDMTYLEQCIFGKFIIFNSKICFNFPIN